MHILIQYCCNCQTENKKLVLSLFTLSLSKCRTDPWLIKHLFRRLKQISVNLRLKNSCFFVAKNPVKSVKSVANFSSCLGVFVAINPRQSVSKILRIFVVKALREIRLPRQKRVFSFSNGAKSVAKNEKISTSNPSFKNHDS